MSSSRDAINERDDRDNAGFDPMDYHATNHQQSNSSAVHPRGKKRSFQKIDESEEAVRQKIKEEEKALDLAFLLNKVKIINTNVENCPGAPRKKRRIDKNDGKSSFDADFGFFSSVPVDSESPQQTSKNSSARKLKF